MARAETRFRLSAKRTSPFKSAGASVQSTTGSRGVRISGNNAGYTMFRGSVKGTGYPIHSPVSPSLPLPCVTVCHHISTGLYSKGKVLLWMRPLLGVSWVERPALFGISTWECTCEVPSVSHVVLRKLMAYTRGGITGKLYKTLPWMIRRP
jgi:hypothetical protein